MTKLFQSLFTQVGKVDPKSFFICISVSVVLGLVIAVCYMYKNSYSRNLVLSIAIIPVIVTVLIMLVSGSLGAAVAVGGIFALTRFRSAQGTAKEITHIFLSMATGLTIGLGYIFIAIILVLVVEVLNLIFTLTHFGEVNPKTKTLKITIPENLDYSNVFDDLFKKYTNKYELCKVKLTDLGTMFQLTYSIELKDLSCEKELIDNIRTRNGNLDILCSRVNTNNEEL